MARELRVKIVGDASSYQRALKQAGLETGKLQSQFTRLGKAAALTAGAAGVGAIAYTLKTGISEFNQAQKVAAQTNAVLKSTGQIANVSAKHLDALGTSIMKMSGIDDEAVKTGENMLLTFTKIRNEVGAGNDIFDQATKAMTDLAVSQSAGVTPSSEKLLTTAIRLGKALQDPIKGVTALRRVGVDFDDQQKEQIKRLVESGQVMQAQKVILRELRVETAGSARALGSTFAGQVNIVRESFRNWAGEMVARMIPTLERLVAWTREHWPQIRATFLQTWASIRPTLIAFGQVVASTAGLIQKHWGTIGPVVRATAIAIRTSIILLSAPLRAIAAILRGDWAGAWHVATGAVMAAVNAYKNVVVFFARKVPKPPGLDALADSFRAVYGWIRKTIDAVKSLVGLLGKIHIPKINVPFVGGDGNVGIRKVPGGLKSMILDDLALGQSLGLSLSSGYRPGAVTSTGNKSLHSVGQAIDMVGPPGAMAHYAHAEAGRSGVAEVLYSPVGGWYPGVGWTKLSGKLRQDHFSHVHVGVRSGDGRVGVGDGIASLRRRRRARPVRRRPVLTSGMTDTNVTLPSSIRLSQASARLTSPLSDDIAAKQAEVAWITGQLGQARPGSERQITLMGMLADARDELRSLQNDASSAGSAVDQSADLEAQLTQSNARAAASAELARLANAFVSTGVFGGGIGMGGSLGAPTIVFNNLIPDAEQIRRATEAIAGGVGTQPYRTTSAVVTGY